MPAFSRLQRPTSSRSPGTWLSPCLAAASLTLSSSSLGVVCFHRCENI